MCLQMFWGRGRGYFFRSAEKPEGYGIERSENHRIHAHVEKKPHGGSGFGNQNNIVLICGFFLGSKLFTLLRRG